MSPPSLVHPPGPDRDVEGNFEFAREHRREVVWMPQNKYTLPVHPAILEAIRARVEVREFNLHPNRAGRR